MRPTYRGRAAVAMTALRKLTACTAHGMGDVLPVRERPAGFAAAHGTWRNAAGHSLTAGKIAGSDPRRHARD